MALKAIISDKTEIPDGLDSFYVERDGKFVLEVEGMKSQVDFDSYAEALKKRYADASADFSRRQGESLDRDEILNRIDEKFKTLFPPGDQDGKPNGQGGNDPEVSQRLHDMERTLASLTESNEKLIAERDAALGKSRETTIQNALSAAAQKAGATPEGISNLVRLAESNFELTQDGQVVTKLDAKGTSPNVSPDDFFAQASRSPEFRMFWPKSVGAGADNDGQGAGGGDLGSSNPWTKSGWNLTQQGKIFKSDPAEANRLMQAAGVKLGATAPVR